MDTEKSDALERIEKAEKLIGISYFHTYCTLMETNVCQSTAGEDYISIAREYYDMGLHDGAIDTAINMCGSCFKNVPLDKGYEAEARFANEKVAECNRLLLDAHRIVSYLLGALDAKDSHGILMDDAYDWMTRVEMMLGGDAE